MSKGDLIVKTVVYASVTCGECGLRISVELCTDAKGCADVKSSEGTLVRAGWLSGDGRDICPECKKRVKLRG